MSTSKKKPAGKKSAKKHSATTTSHSRHRMKISELQIAANLEHAHAEDLAEAVAAYEKNPKDFYSAWHFLEVHPANTRRLQSARSAGVPFSCFEQNLCIMVVKVHPETGRIHPTPDGESDPNTKTAIWLEWGPHFEQAELAEPGLPAEVWSANGLGSHDCRCDTGASSFEKAIVNLAHNVYALYGLRSRVSHEETLPDQDRW